MATEEKHFALGKKDNLLLLQRQMPFRHIGKKMADAMATVQYQDTAAPGLLHASPD